MTAFPLAFIEQAPHGLLVAVRLDAPLAEVDEDGLALVHPDERALALPWAPRRRRTWAGGRVALRRALVEIGVAVPGPIARDDRGAPVVPAGVRASISHKDDLAVALVARVERDDEDARLGVDVEALPATTTAAPAAPDVSRHVLTAAELAELAGLDHAARAREVTTRFSAKESVYKALDPYVRRFVGFQEVEARPDPASGLVATTLLLTGGEGPFVVEARYVVRDAFVVTTARIARP